MTTMSCMFIEAKNRNIVFWGENNSHVERTCFTSLLLHLLLDILIFCSFFNVTFVNFEPGFMTDVT